MTPLHCTASLNGMLEVVCALLAHGADVRAIVANGITALHIASLEGHDEVVRLLLASDHDTSQHLQSLNYYTGSEVWEPPHIMPVISSSMRTRTW
jgi:ankyrin repeat protein